MNNPALAPVDRLIVTVRGRQVLLAHDLAGLYGVEPRALNQAVKRNPCRFPADFAFRLSLAETRDALASGSQAVILKRGSNPKYGAMAFTEHGAVMAATVLNSQRAVRMSLFVVRAFIRLRGWAIDREELGGKLAELERRVSGHDRDLQAIVHGLRSLMEPPEHPQEPARRIGFGSETSRPTTR